MFRSAAALLLLFALPEAAPRAQVQLGSTPGERAAQPAIQAAIGARAKERLSELERALRDKRSSPDAALPLMQAFELRGELPAPPVALVQLIAEVAEAQRTHPDVRALARNMLGHLERGRGRLAKAEELFGKLGALHAFHLVGPFDNENKGGFDKVFPPEKEQQLTRRYPGKTKEIGWRRIPDLSTIAGEQSALTPLIDLSSLYEQTEETVLYALAILDSATEREAVLHLGASGAAKLFLNGARVLTDPNYHPARLDQASVRVRLAKGANRLLLKLCTPKEGRAGFILRVTDPEGNALRFSSTAPEVLPPQPKGRGGARALPNLAVPFRSRAKAAPKSWRARYEYAQMLHFLRSFDATSRLAAKESAEASKLLGAEEGAEAAKVHYLAASLADDQNAMRSFLEAALRARPQQVDATALLAFHYLAREMPARALELTEGALAVESDALSLELARAAALKAMGMEARSERAIMSLAERAPNMLPAIEEAARVARERGRADEAIARYRVLVGLKYDQLSARQLLAALLFKVGKTDEALAELKRLILLDPWDTNYLTRYAESAAANGRGVEAREALSLAKALAPESADIYVMEGQVLARLYDREAAITAYTRALELRPQASNLRETLAALQEKAREPAFGEAYARDAAALAAELRKKPLPDGADSGVLDEFAAVKLLSGGLAHRLVQRVIAVTNMRGVEQERAQWIGWSPDRQRLRILRARVHKADGSVVDSHTESDHSLSDESVRIYYDARARRVLFPALMPGDVLELRYKLDDIANDNLLSDLFGDVVTVQSHHYTRHFDYYLEAPAERPIYASAPALLAAEQRAGELGEQLYHWSALDLARLAAEPSMPPLSEVAQPLHVSTSNDWAAIGRYYWGLVREQLLPTRELEDLLAELRAPLSPGDDLALVKAVYGFVVERTRYVGLEFGIHGYKPYRVDTILARRFGDCKDKASLMHALLSLAGIDSNLTLVRTRRNGRLPDSPASLAVFDHAILYVPRFDLFLDGTAELHGSLELPQADRGASVLIVVPDGESRLTRIPESSAEANRTEVEERFSLAPDGSAMLEGRTTLIGLPAPGRRRALQAPESRQRNIERALARQYPGSTVERSSTSQLSVLEKPVVIDYVAKVPRAAKREGERLSLSPFGAEPSLSDTLASLPSRTQPLQLDYPFQVKAASHFLLPSATQVEVPDELEVKSPFGAYHVTFETHSAPSGEQALVVKREFTLTSGRIEPIDYPSFRAFLRSLDEANKRKVWLSMPSGK